MSLFAELKRRNVIRMGGLYLVGAWLIVQVLETVLPAFDVPAWVLRTTIILLAIGFVPALVFSWVFELTPDGLKRDGDVAAGESIAPKTAQRMDRLIFVGLLLLVGTIVADRFWPRVPMSTPAGTDVAAQTDNVAAVEAVPTSAATAPASSIAVLPFTDLSQGGDQAYFSDGISEEILNALVKVKGLEVASRTSSFGFKGQDALGIPEIADKLSVRNILEGSVRRAGSTLRITAQLIDAQTDRHLWSETYDRPLTAENVFAIQEEIATAIVAALKTSLDIPEIGSVSLTHSTANLTAYDLYLQARALFLERRSLAECEALLQKALEQDPEFAKAWELRAAVNSLMHEYKASALGAEELDRRSVDYAQRAMALDPQSSLALAALANARGNGGRNLREIADYVGIVADLERAIEFDPHNVNAMNWLGITFALLGDSERALASLQRCAAVDSTFGPCMENQYDLLWVLGRADEAYAHMLDGWSRGVNVEGYVNFSLLAHYEQRSTFLLALTNPLWLPKWRRGDELYEAFRHLDRDHTALRDDLLVFLSDRGSGRNMYMGALLVPLGAFDQAPPSWLLWSADFKRYRQSPQFRNYVERSGVLAYWKAKGFPKGCHATTADQFECE